MKMTLNLEIDGLTCSLSFEVSVQALRALIGDSSFVIEDEELINIFDYQACQMPQQLSDAKQLFLSNLLSSSNDLLKVKLG